MGRREERGGGRREERGGVARGSAVPWHVGTCACVLLTSSLCMTPLVITSTADEASYWPKHVLMHTAGHSERWLYGKRGRRKTYSVSLAGGEEWS